jgi:hypothetical protein
MADEASQSIEDALNIIVNTTDQSGNLRKDLKKTIYDTVSTLRNLFHNMKELLDERNRQNKLLEKEATKLNIDLDNRRNTTPKRHPETSNVSRQEPPRTDTRQVLPPHGSSRKLYSSVVAGQVETKHKVLIRSRANHTPR